jgi:hypothetical protein
VNAKYKQEATGEFVEVPEWKTVGHRDVWKWVKAPTPDDPYRKIYTKVKEPIKEKTGKMVKRAVHKRTSEVAYEKHY